MGAKADTILLVATSEDNARQYEEALADDPSLGATQIAFAVEYFGEARPSGRYAFSARDLSDPEERAALLADLSKAGIHPSRVVDTDEYSVLPAAELAASLGVPGLAPADLARFRDKGLMLDRLAGTDIPVPRRVPAAEVARASFPLVLKPRAGAASQGVRLARSPEELPPAAECAGLIIEEFVEGDVYHLDGLVRSGEILFFSASRYIGTCLDFAQGKPQAGITLPPGDERDAWLRFAESVTRALAPPPGAFHLEAFLRPDGSRVFLEIAVRPGGLPIVPTTRAVRSFDLALGHLRLRLGMDVGDIVARSTSALHGGYIVFPKLPVNGGRRLRCSRHPDYKRGLRSQVILEKLPPLGTDLHAPHYSDCLVAVALVAPDRRDVEADIAGLFRTFPADALSEPA